MLEDVSEKLPSYTKAVLLVDALDEVDNIGLPPATNPLYLPITLPPSIFVVVTMRKVPLSIRIDVPHSTLDIEQDSVGNIADVRNYVQGVTARPGILAYMASHSIDDTRFVDLLVEKSQGNFMYLRYVLPEIESGAYKGLALDTIPTGLRNYYEDHWQRMKGRSGEDWFKYKLPILMALTVVKEAISIDLLEKFSGIRNRPRICAMLEEWQPFLHEEQVSYEDSSQKHSVFIMRVFMISLRTRRR